MSQKDIETWYMGNTVPYEKSIGTHDSFSALREIFLGQDIFQLNATQPYPIENSTVAKSGYKTRGRLEKQILDRSLLRADKNILIIKGGEGVGKSTALHYSLGHKYWIEHTDEFDGTIFLVFNLKEWLSSETPELTLDRVVSRINLRMGRGSAANLLEDFRKLRAQRADLQMLPKIDPPLSGEAIAAFLAYVSAGQPGNGRSKKLVLVFDNIDTVGKAQQLNILKAIHTLHSSVEEFREAFIGNHTDKAKNFLYFVISMRPETHHSLFSNSTGAAWPPPAKVATVDLNEPEDLNPWTLLKLRIKANDLFATQTLDQMRVTLNFGEAKVFDAISDPRTYVLNLIDWLDAQAPSAAREIRKFCGNSVRRRMMFATKILGHPHWRTMYFDARKRNIQGQIAKSTIHDAMYDFMQPLGGVDLLDHRSFFLNPHYIVEHKTSLIRAPLLGVHTLLYLGQHRDHDDNVARSAIFERLLAFGYQKNLIEEAIGAFSRCALLKPVFTSSSEVPSSYDIDLQALQKYHDLITAKNREETGVFAAQVIRHIQGLNAYLPMSFVLERCHLMLIFLHEIWQAGQRLERQVREEVSGRGSKIVDLQIPNYPRIVGSRLFPHVEKIVNNFADGVAMSGELLRKHESCRLLLEKHRTNYKADMPLVLGGILA